MLDIEASSQRGNFCVSFTFLKLRMVCSVFIDWLAHGDLIGTDRLLKIQSLFIPHEDLFQQKKEEAREPCCVPSQLRPLYCYHEKHVTMDELRK